MRFSLPAINRALVMANLAIGIPAFIVSAVPTLITIGLFLLILPGIILAILPTVFLYLALLTICWFAFQRFHPIFAFLSGLAAMLAFGIILPQTLNEDALSTYNRAAKSNLSPPTKIPPVRQIAIELPPSDTNPTCSDLCQALLYNKEVDFVLFTHPDPAHRVTYRIERTGNCSDPKPMLTVPSNRHWLNHKDREPIRKAVQTRIAAGECLVLEHTPNSTAPLTFRYRDDNPNPRPNASLFQSTPISIEGMEILQNGKVIASSLKFTAMPLSVPVAWEPVESGMGYSGWRWSHGFLQTKATPIPEFLAQCTSYDLQVPIGLSTSDIQRILSSALANPNLPKNTSSFALIPDYLNSLRDKTPAPQDLNLVSAIIRDRRIEDLNIPDKFFKHPSATAPFTSALLDRALSLRGTKELYKYNTGDSWFGALPPGALATPDPRIDAILSSAELRLYMPKLIEHLSDRGPQIALTLLGIIKESWVDQIATPPAHWATDANAALTALCQIGPDAANILPQLQALPAPPSVNRDENWYATQVSLGANIDSLSLPNINNFRDTVLKLASKRCRPR